MKPAHSLHGQTDSCLRHAREQGQALVLGLFLLAAVSLLVFMQFSVGQATTTRDRLATATDAAAYSVAVWRARAMNFDAYSNRAIIANEVAIAQAATMVSYARYIEKLSSNIDKVARYFPYVSAVSKLIEALADYTKVATENTAQAETAARSTYIQALQKSQQIMAKLTGKFVLSSVAGEIARENDRSFFAFTLPDALDGTMGDFTREYSGKDRQRLKEVVLGSLDPYSKRRDDSHLGNGMCIVSGQRRGATELIRRHDTDELERWQAYDTLSMHNGCRETVPLGWGGAEIAVNAHRRLDPLNGMGRPASRSKRDNKLAYKQAADDVWTAQTYFGLASVRDLDYRNRAMMAPNDRFPVDRITVMGWVNDSADVRTADQTRIGAGRLHLSDRRGGGETRPLSSIATAEIYFRRPPKDDGRIEYASLYSPYWQVRLAPTSDAVRSAAAALYLLRD